MRNGFPFSGYERFFANCNLGLEAQSLLGLFGCPPEARTRHRVSLPQVDAVLVLKSREQMFRQQVVEVVTAELVVTMTGQHLGDVPFQSDDGNIKCPTAPGCRKP